MTPAQEATLKKVLTKVFEYRGLAHEFHHGDCVGADEQAHQLLKWMRTARDTPRVRVILHPPDNPSKRANCRADEVRKALPYLERNKEIVDETQFLIATPKGTEEELRSGTWATMRDCLTKMFSSSGTTKSS